MTTRRTSSASGANASRQPCYCLSLFEDHRGGDLGCQFDLRGWERDMDATGCRITSERDDLMLQLEPGALDHLGVIERSAVRRAVREELRLLDATRVESTAQRASRLLGNR